MGADHYGNDEDFELGSYVNHSDYKMMRLRILMTGTSGPTEEEMSAGLTRLLDHLEKHPMPTPPKTQP